jgi:hypothetical protein
VISANIWCVCVYVCIHTYLSIHTNVCIHTYIHACMHACIHTYPHAYIRIGGPNEEERIRWMESEFESDEKSAPKAGRPCMSHATRLNPTP